ncbi:MAG TPA: hypothetical protein VK171_05260 [Fimbriimonas sp.]|nr:hypothetical protein [Fimbriimonas sp.]
MKFKTFWIWFVALWLLTGLPLFLLHGVPGTDTPNHVARLHMLANPAAYAGSYIPDWKLIPNLAVDLLIVPVLKLTGIDATLLMKVFIFNIFGFFGFGFALVNRAVSKKWQPFGLLGFLFCFSYTMGFGFINYLFGISVALCLVGVQLLLVDRPLLRFFVLSLGLPLLTVMHLMGFGFAALSILVLAVLSKDRQDRTRFFWGGWLFGCLMALVLVKSSSADPVGLGLVYDALDARFRNLFFPLNFSGQWMDFVLWCVVVLLVCWAAFVRKNHPNKVAGWILVGGLAFVACLPHVMMGSAFLAARSSLWVFLLGFALIRDCRLALSTVVLIIGIRTIDVTSRFLAWNPTLDSVQAAMASLPPDAIIYQFGEMSADPLTPNGWNPPILHANCGYLLEHPGFVNNVFAFEGEQPISIHPDFRPRLHSRYYVSEAGAMRLYQEVLGAMKKHTGARAARPVFLYVLLSGADKAPALPAPVQVSGSRFVVFRLR